MALEIATTGNAGAGSPDAVGIGGRARPARGGRGVSLPVADNRLPSRSGSSVAASASVRVELSAAGRARAAAEQRAAVRSAPPPSTVVLTAGLAVADAANPFRGAGAFSGAEAPDVFYTANAASRVDASARPEVSSRLAAQEASAVPSAEDLRAAAERGLASLNAAPAPAQVAVEPPPAPIIETGDVAAVASAPAVVAPPVLPEARSANVVPAAEPERSAPTGNAPTPEQERADQGERTARLAVERSRSGAAAVPAEATGRPLPTVAASRLDAAPDGVLPRDATRFDAAAPEDPAGVAQLLGQLGERSEFAAVYRLFDSTPAASAVSEGPVRRFEDRINEVSQQVRQRAVAAQMVNQTHNPFLVGGVTAYQGIFSLG